MANENPDYKAEADRILSENMPSITGEGFIAVHEIYLSLKAAGFTEYQLLWLIGYMISNAAGREFDEEGGK